MKNLFGLSLLSLAIAACGHTTNNGHKSSHNNSQTRTLRMPAQDNTTTEVTHASSDGRFIAFFEEVVLDGSGAPSSSFRILDTIKNKYIFDKTIANFHVNEDESAEATVFAQQRTDLLTLAKSTLDKNKLKAQKITPVVDYSTLNKGGNYMNEKLTAKGEFTVRGQQYSFEVAKIPASPSHFANKDMLSWCIPEYEPNMYSLIVNGKTVHRDERVPRSRGCPLEYGVDKVYDVHGKVVVFIRYTKIGFEGPDFRTITLPLK